MSKRFVAVAVSAASLFVLGLAPTVMGLSAAAHAATATTVVSIQFDDGVADQYQALAILNAHGLHATFYVNSGVIGDAAHMSWTELSDLFAAGNEIGGHTTFHTNVKKLKTQDARIAICDDRVAIYGHGLQPTSFAYPFGSFDAGSEAVVQACGYNSGRGVSGVNDRRVFAETIPPVDPYGTRTPPNPKQGTTLATIESYVTAAETHGGGWVQLVFHHVCDNNCDAYAITAANLDALCAWLQARSASGTVVETTAQVIGGSVSPPIPA